MFSAIFKIAGDAWNIVASALYSFILPITIATLVFLVMYRIVMANLLYIERNEKAQWIYWGFLVVYEFTLFAVALLVIPIPSYWLIAQVALFLLCFIWVIIFDQPRQMRDLIYRGSLVNDDQSDRYSGNKENNELKEARKAREAKIRRIYSRDNMQWKAKVPVFSIIFRFRLSPSATPEQEAKVASQAGKYYSNYDFRYIRKGKFFEISASVQVDSIKAVPFDVKLSDALDWYVVPCGVIDASSEKSATMTPYVWMMHDPKTEKKSYPELKYTTLQTAAPQGFIIGQTGGGKSVLLNTLIAHWVNKAKKTKQTRLFLADAKMVEFEPYKKIKEVEQVAQSLEELVDVTDMFCEKMHERNRMMAAEGLKKIPLDGKVVLKKHIDINGHIIPLTDVLEVKMNDGSIKKMRAFELKGRTDIAEINIPEPEKEEEEESGFSW